MKPARQIAVGLLDRIDLQKSDVSSELNKVIGNARERGFLTELVYGVVRNLNLIDHLICTIGSLKLKNINKRALNILRIGVYELIFSSQQADYAVINEAVSLAKTRGGKKLSSFANAILREIQRNIKGKFENVEKLSSSLLPIGSQRYCEFVKPILPEPEKDGGEYLSVCFSLPDWLVAGWVKQFGFERAMKICIASNRRPGVYVRANTRKIKTQKLCDLFNDSDVEHSFDDKSDMLRLNSATGINKLPGFDDGLFIVQDITAAGVVRSLNIDNIKIAIDICSAPGGKAIQLSEKFSNSTVYATDINPKRLKKVVENKNRLHAENLQVIEYDKLKSIGKVDLVLADVPCSNTGVLTKRLEVRHRITQRSIQQLAGVQKDILQTAASLVNDSGAICYSTCSIEEIENQQQIQNFLAENKNFTLEFEKLTLPKANDGGYFALLKKR